MERRAVDSSSVLSVRYDDEAQILELEFRGGAIYRYDGVGSDIVQQLLDGRSIGRFVNQVIKTTYPERRVTARCHALPGRSTYLSPDHHRHQEPP
jgi:hypothetical protein